jgi:tetratricopeptide (TPR) repeat protein
LREGDGGGVVLYQMVTGGSLPFTARSVSDFYQLHRYAPVPTVDSPLFPVIRRCMEKEPGKRYQSFRALRKDLEPLLKQQTGEVIRPPELKDLELWEWVNKGVSLRSLGRYAEAIRCYDTALEIDPRYALA